MKAVSRWLGVSLGSLTFAACTEVTEVQMPDLARIVERDGVPFDVESIPSAILDRLSAHKLVIVGETHLIREHRELMAQVVEGLHVRGFRQLLLEYPQMADWLMADFVEDGPLDTGWEPPTWLYGDLITAVRDFNRTLPVSERVQLRGIDVNLDDYGGARDFRNLLTLLASHLTDPGPVTAFLADGAGSSGSYTAHLETLRDALAAGRGNLVGSWGASTFETVSEMVEVELASVPIRALRSDRYDLSVRLRESVMKRLADLRLEGYPHRTLINVGGNHAQKKYLKGTEQEWLGDYLVHGSKAVGGSAIVLNVTPATVRSGAGSTAVDNDELAASAENELWRLMRDTWPDRIVFLPADDPIFMTGGVPLNFEGTIYVAAPKRHYDVFVLLPLAHRIPIPRGG